MENDKVTDIRLTLPLFGVGIVLFYQLLFDAVLSKEAIVILGTLSGLYGLLVSTLWPRFQLNFIAVYGAYLFLCNFGVAAIETFVPGTLFNYLETTNLKYHSIAWYFSRSADTAVTLAALGVTSYFAIATLFHPDSSRSYTDRKPSVPFANAAIFALGVVLAGFSCVYALVNFGSLAVSGVSYSEFKSARAGVDAYPWFLFAYSTSMPLLAAVAKKQYKWPLIALCAVPAFILLITGNRGEVLYSLAATFAILGLRNVRVSLPIVSVALLIFFLMVPLIREFRSIGIRSFTFQQSALSTFDPFLELGFQLRPLEITVGWIEGGEAHAQGGTYLLPLQRIAGRLSLMQAPELEGNRMDVQNRTPGLGYNVIAEAFFNFGAIGVAAVMGLLGYLMAFFSQRSTSLTQLGLYGVITAILLNSLRNSFLFVPGQLLVLSVLFAAAWYARPYFAMFHGFVEE